MTNLILILYILVSPPARVWYWRGRTGGMIQYHQLLNKIPWCDSFNPLLLSRPRIPESAVWNKPPPFLNRRAKRAENISMFPYYKHKENRRAKRAEGLSRVFNYKNTKESAREARRGLFDLVLALSTF